MARPARPPRSSALAAAALVVGLAACSPITTQEPYAASDGVQVDLGGQIAGQNLLVLTTAEGEPGLLLGALTNDGTSPTAVTLQVGSTAVALQLEPGHTVLLSAPDATPTATLSVTNISLAAVEAAPGSLTDLTLSTPESGAVSVEVPVLDGTLDPYDDVLSRAPETSQ